MPTAWHITFGTYGQRLHGDERLTVDRKHNLPGTPLVEDNVRRESWEQAQLAHDPVTLTHEQRLFIEREVLSICERGGWQLLACAAAPDHVHTLLRAPSAIDGKRLRTWLKRWMGDALSAQFGKIPGSWWAEGGSARPVKDGHYFDNAKRYVLEQRTTRE